MFLTQPDNSPNKVRISAHPQWKPARLGIGNHVKLDRRSLYICGTTQDRFPRNKNAWK